MDIEHNQNNLPNRQAGKIRETYVLIPFHSKHHRNRPLTWSQLESRHKSSMTIDVDY